jgi:hypothetical protein
MRRPAQNSNNTIICQASKDAHTACMGGRGFWSPSNLAKSPKNTVGSHKCSFCSFHLTHFPILRSLFEL